MPIPNLFLQLFLLDIFLLLFTLSKRTLCAFCALYKRDSLLYLDIVFYLNEDAEVDD